MENNVENAFGDSEFRKSKEYKLLKKEVEKELSQKEITEFSSCKELYDLLIEKDYKAISGKLWYDPEIHSFKLFMSDYMFIEEWKSMNNVNDLESSAWETMQSIIGFKK